MYVCVCIYIYIEPEDQETHWDPMELLLFLFMTLLLLMFPFHDGCMLEWNCINYQSVRNHWKEYTHHLSLFDTCLVSLDSPSFGNFFAHQRVHQITAGKAGTVHLVAALFSSLLWGRSAGRIPPLKTPLHGNCYPKDLSITFLK